MKNGICVSVICALFLLSFNFALAEEKPKMTKDDLLANIKDTLEEEEELFDYIPELKKHHKDRDDKEFYTYHIDNRDVRLEDLDEEKLEKILTRVNNQLVMIRTDRINRQLEVIRRAQSVVTRPPQVPMVTTPPTRPSTPTPPPRTPQTPPTHPKK